MESDKQPTLLSQNHADDKMDCEGKLGDFCLVCFSKVDRSKIPTQDNLLSNNLNVIFLLRNVLQVPIEPLIANFKECGSPACWINLCDHCSQLTGEAMERHLQILTLVNQLRSIVKIITDKMKESSVLSAEALAPYQDHLKDDKEKSMEEKRLHILKSTREFVTNYDYNIHLVNPFIEGDKLARELDEMDQNRCSSDDSEEEYEKVDGKWKCRQCDKLFGWRYNARNHELEEHAAVPGQYKCDICGKVKNTAYYLNEHIRKTRQKRSAEGKLITIKPEKPVEKEKSEEEKAKDAERKRAPVQVVNGKWKCRHCANELRSRKSFCRHVRWQHPPVPGDLKCDYCEREMNSKAALYAHQRNTHRVDWAGIPIRVKPRPPRPPRNFKRERLRARSTCHLCKNSFTELHVLKKHLKYVHDKQFDIRCHVCGMGTRSTYGLNMHLMRMHKEDPVTLKLIEEGAKIWKCEVSGCRATFWKESGLEEHTRKVHEGGGERGNGEQEADKRFTCAFCGKSFRHRYPLKVHETSHKLGKERPYSCDVCGAKFKTIANVRKHKRRFHSEVC